MIIALDIETIPNASCVPLLPEPDVKTGNVKDPAKIAEKIAEAKTKQIADMALDAMTGRVACVAMANDEHNTVRVLDADTDEAETALVQETMAVLGSDGCRLVTWNGNGFDIPFIYKRALILGVHPADFGAPVMTAWTKRYNTDLHFDLMQIWGLWTTEGREKLDAVAAMVLRERKIAVDVTQFAQMLTTPEGREAIGSYCLQDTRLTWRLFKKMQGWLFA